MAIGESQAFLGKPVDVGRADARGAVAAQVAIAEVIRVNQDNVGPIGGVDRRSRKNDRREKQNYAFHRCRTWGVKVP
jgi:hypothetical protein